ALLLQSTLPSESTTAPWRVSQAFRVSTLSCSSAILPLLVVALDFASKNRRLSWNELPEGAARACLAARRSAIATFSLLSSPAKALSRCPDVPCSVSYIWPTSDRNTYFMD